jgi:hypothetical protein
VATTKRPLDVRLPPSQSGTPEAVIWQQDFDVDERRRDDGKMWKVDRNVSVLPDPSAP